MVIHLKLCFLLLPKKHAHIWKYVCVFWAVMDWRPIPGEFMPHTQYSRD